MRVIKAGVIDDVNVLNNVKHGAELYAPQRLSHVTALSHANQLDGMPPA